MNRINVSNIQMDILKKTIITLSSGILAFMQPVQNTVHLLIFLFVGNLIAGIFHDVMINRNKFQFKKFLWSGIEFLVYVCLVCGIYIIGHFQNDKLECQFIIKMISYLFIYAYSTNILKNLILIFPNNIVFKFLYYVLSLTFIKKIPYFADFMNQQKEKNDE